MDNHHPEPQWTCGELTLHLYSKTASVEGQPVFLTPLEFKLLHYLFIHRPRPVPAEELLEHVWEHSDGGTANQVMCCVRRLRQKLAVGEDTPQYIHTVRGFGYRLCEPEGLPPTGVNEAEGAIDR